MYRDPNARMPVVVPPDPLDPTALHALAEAHEIDASELELPVGSGTGVVSSCHPVPVELLVKLTAKGRARPDSVLLPTEMHNVETGQEIPLSADDWDPATVTRW